MIVFTDETLEYNYPAVILYFLPNPNAQQIMLFKMLVVAALIVIYEIISLLIRLITQTVNTHILEGTMSLTQLGRRLSIRNI